MSLTFEQLPAAISELSGKLEKIERLITDNRIDSKPEPDQILTVQQAAQFLFLSVPTIYGLVHRREIPVCKRGKRLYFSKQDLIKWVKTTRIKTVSELADETEGYLQTRKGSKS